MALLMTASFVGCDFIASLIPSGSESEVTSEATSEEGTSEEPGTSEEEEEVPAYLFMGDNTVSVAAGETATPLFAVMGAMFGTEYTLSWTSENAVVTVNGETVEGTSTTIVYTPMLYITVSTADGAAEDIVIMVGAAEAAALPTVTLGETTVEVSAENAGWGVEYTFTAEETAMYTITATHENCTISWGTSDYSKSGYVTYGAAEEFGLEAGETINLSVGTANYEGDTVTFTLTKGGAYDPSALIVGDNMLKVKEETGVAEYTFTATVAGNYAINSWSTNDPATATEEDPAVQTISYTVNGETTYVTSAYTLISLAAGDVITFTANVYADYCYYEGSCSLDLSIKSVALVNSSLTVSIVDGQATVYFYATAPATYDLAITEGAQIMTYDWEIWELVAITSVVADEENSLIALSIYSDTLTEATITITEAR